MTLATATAPASSGKGLALAALILLAWIVSLAVLLPADSGHLPLPLLLLAVLLRSVLHTGLFIVGHDAMHGLLLPGRPRANHGLGQLALGLYAGLPYRACRANHLRHHRAPGSASDPDHHPQHGPGILRWYVHFMAGYLGVAQMLLLLTGWTLLALITAQFSHGALQNVLLFCTLPLLISSLQLFVFGTYLPHRERPGETNSHQARSLELPVWLSLLACFHFGYHWEHHEFPTKAWFQLPGMRRLRFSARRQSLRLAHEALPR
ncbi:beta-carotene ketolase [Synechococcus sp. BSF8S]|uniref:fatty acid desaturase n=1 Tax=Synechococcales TaxID=1890424 RepID=UPI0016279779|nr:MULTISPECIES: fatty acid desaturase [unclassified Synechococcus]MBC1261287.1 beta-carotene ketolase [Synechococcus sp. BSF8S]MBC1264190.1 beta-carotene ketolase [Synechococcus sp. BSA11S]